MTSNLSVTMAASHQAVTGRQRSGKWAFMTRLQWKRWKIRQVNADHKEQIHH